ncbi:hypothetical protein EV44_g0068 [Erysiphe necator]|uniref:Uncharacterized protein n=1 Tax=Uncinula necator TaxID=52586 RepID=A0A0B1P0A0_UNCNE|nr:hypothetical protein EV44_g0068 [Erysiphe necator]
MFEFFIIFHVAYLKTMTKLTINAGFRGARLVPFDPEAVIMKLDVRLWTPKITELPFVDIDSWISWKTWNITKALLLSVLVKNRILQHQKSSLTPIFQTIAAMGKVMETIAHEITLLTAELPTLRKVNESPRKRYWAIKTRIRHGGVL